MATANAGGIYDLEIKVQSYCGKIIHSWYTELTGKKQLIIRCNLPGEKDDKKMHTVNRCRTCIYLPK